MINRTDETTDAAHARLKRTQLEALAKKVLGAQNISHLSERQIHEHVLAIVSPGFRCAGRTDEALAAAFDMAMALGGFAPAEQSTMRADRREESPRPSALEDARARRMRHGAHEPTTLQEAHARRRDAASRARTGDSHE